jgi:hypothetical protein
MRSWRSKTLLKYESFFKKCWHTAAFEALRSFDFRREIEETNQIKSEIVRNNTRTNMVIRLFEMTSEREMGSNIEKTYMYPFALLCRFQQEDVRV